MADAHLMYLLPSQPFREVSSSEQYQVTAMPSLHNIYVDVDAGRWQQVQKDFSFQVCNVKPSVRQQCRR
jgi:hypothetical protein